MASPLVAGAAALICAAHPEVSVPQLKAALIYNGDFVPSHAYKTLTGRRLNAFKALQAIVENDTTPPAAINYVSAPLLRISTENALTKQRPMRRWAC